MKISRIALVSATTAIIGIAAISCTSTGENEANESSRTRTDMEASKLQLHTIYFDFDRYNIRDDQEENAARMAKSLKAGSNTKIQIQGNTDDRGSVEYNMALGTRRANALKNYLITYGVESDNIDTVSYGKERPAVQGADENVWAQNRRDDVIAIAE